MNKLTGFLMMLAVSISVCACTNMQAKNELKVEKADALVVTATVVAIDMKSRLVTLRSPEDKVLVVYAGKEVVNLPQVRIGDVVALSYINMVSVRRAESGEVWDESVMEVVRAAPGTKPGAAIGSEDTVTATIEDIDKTLQTANLRLPDDSLKIVKVKDPANLDKVKVGDRIVITSSEIVSISVQTPAN